MALHSRSCSLAVVALGLSMFGDVSSVMSQDKPIYNSEKSTLPYTLPAETVAGMKLPDGFVANVFASEPDVQQPIGINFDQRGRLWVAENYTYAERGQNFDRDLRDQIVILEDVDGDGVAESRKVFWNGGTCITSVETDHDGVWVLDLPRLIFIPDRNHDDLPDGEPEVVLDGFDRDSVRHNFANGLRWGPDGWLYGRHGILVTSFMGRPGTPREERVPVNCGIWRYHPQRRVVETVAHGTTNPWGMDWDEHGQLFFINTVIGHLWHVVPGAQYERMFGEPLRANTYELIPQTADHFHWDTNEIWSDIRKIGVSPTTDQAGGGHAHCGLMFYQGTQWPQEYRGNMFTLNLHGHRLNREVIERSGATYVGKHAPDFMHVPDPWFRGVELVTGPDGSVYIADWTDVGECHEDDGVHRTSGRIFRVSYPAGLQNGDSGNKDATLLSELFSENEVQSRFALRAIRTLAGSQGSQELIANLQVELATAPAERVRLRALWGLNALQAVNHSMLLALLAKDESEHVRVWAIQLLGERTSLDEATSQALLTHARSETSGLVLTFLASTLPKVTENIRLDLALAISSHEEFAADRVLPLMVWYGIEPLVTAHPEAAVKLAVQSRTPRLRRFIPRLLASTVLTRGPSLDAIAPQLHTLPDSVRLDVLQGIAEGLQGVSKVPAPAQWSATAAVLAKSDSEEVRRRSQELSLVFGDGRAIAEIKALAADRRSASVLRRQALNSLVAAREESVLPLLKSLLTHRDLGVDAVRGLAAIHDVDTPHLLLQQYHQLRPEAQYEAVTTLASRPEFAAVMIDGVAAGKLPKDAVTPFLLRQIQTFGDAQLAARVDGLWPGLKQLAEDKRKKVAEWKERLSDETLAAADASAGRVVFEQTCAKCHRLFGSPMGVGPDLTGAQRSNLHYLLENILDPSAQVAENYRLAIVLLDDGRVINGIPAARTELTTTYNTTSGPIVVENSHVEDLRLSSLSFMPDGQLDLLTSDQAANLIKYLMQPEQVPLP